MYCVHAALQTHFVCGWRSYRLSTDRIKAIFEAMRLEVANLRRDHTRHSRAGIPILTSNCGRSWRRDQRWTNQREDSRLRGRVQKERTRSVSRLQIQLSSLNTDQERTIGPNLTRNGDSKYNEGDQRIGEFTSLFCDAPTHL